MGNRVDERTLRSWLNRRTDDLRLTGSISQIKRPLRTRSAQQDFTPIEDSTEQKDTYRAIIDGRRFSTDEATVVDQSESCSEYNIERRTLYCTDEGELFLYRRSITTWAEQSRLLHLAENTLIAGTLINIFPVISGFTILFLLTGFPMLSAGLIGSVYIATGMYCAVEQPGPGIDQQRIEHLDGKEALYDVVTQNNMVEAVKTIVDDPDFVADTTAGAIYRLDDYDMLIKDGQDVTLLTAEQAEAYLKEHQQFNLFDRFFSPVPSA